jgi:hypothetical protein
MERILAESAGLVVNQRQKTVQSAAELFDTKNLNIREVALYAKIRVELY